jgi:hypothetical protein
MLTYSCVEIPPANEVRYFCGYFIIRENICQVLRGIKRKAMRVHIISTIQKKPFDLMAEGRMSGVIGEER